MTDRVCTDDMKPWKKIAICSQSNVEDSGTHHGVLSAFMCFPQPFLTGAHCNTMPDRQRSRSPIPYAWRWAWRTDGENGWWEWFEASRERAIADRPLNTTSDPPRSPSRKRTRSP